MGWSAFVLGLISSLHCLGMCAPLQLSVMGAWGSKRNNKHLGLYHLSRIATYGVLGGIVGSVGIGINLQQWQQEASLMSGLLLLLAFFTFYILKLDRKFMRVLFPYLSRARAQLQRNKQARSLYFAGSGMLNGILPCGMVYLALFPALGSGSWINAVGYMLLFGVGTLPLLVLSGIGGVQFLQSKGIWIQRVIPVFVFTIAVLLIFRGMNLDIPYLSPAIVPETASTEVCG